MAKKVVEFIHENNKDRWIATENEDGTVIVDFVPFQLKFSSWRAIDDMKDDSKLFYVSTSESIEIHRENNRI